MRRNASHSIRFQFFFFFDYMFIFDFFIQRIEKKQGIRSRYIDHHHQTSTATRLTISKPKPTKEDLTIKNKIEKEKIIITTYEKVTHSVWVSWNSNIARCCSFCVYIHRTIKHKPLNV